MRYPELGVYELAERRSAGVIVRLLWDAGRDQAVLRYRDGASGDAFVTDVPNASALAAFRHPHAYRGPAPASGRCSKAAATAGPTSHRAAGRDARRPR